MLLDSILLVILSIFVIAGLVRGALATGTNLATLIVAYLAAVWAAGHLGPDLARELELSEFYGAPIAGSLGFLVGYVIASLVGWVLLRWDRLRSEGHSRGWIDRIVGGAFGSVRGGLVVLLLCWLAIWLDAARDLELASMLDSMPETENSRVASITRKTVAGVVGKVLGDGANEPGSRVVARLASDPGTTLKGLQELLDSQQIIDLQEDRHFWILIENGASDSALNRLSFYRIAHDEELRRNLADLGVISEEAAGDIDVLHAEAAAVFAEIGPRLKGLRDDPELQQMAQDPEIVSLLQNGDTLALLRRPEIRRIVDRIASQP